MSEEESKIDEVIENDANTAEAGENADKDVTSHSLNQEADEIQNDNAEKEDDNKEVFTLYGKNKKARKTARVTVAMTELEKEELIQFFETTEGENSKKIIDAIREAKLKKTDAKIPRMASKIKEIHDFFDAIESVIDSMVKTANAFETTIQDEYDDKLKNLQSQNAELAKKLSNAEEENKSLKETNEKISAELEVVKNKFAAADAQLTDRQNMQKQVDELQTIVRMLQERIIK